MVWLVRKVQLMIKLVSLKIRLCIQASSEWRKILLSLLMKGKRLDKQCNKARYICSKESSNWVKCNSEMHWWANWFKRGKPSSISSNQLSYWNRRKSMRRSSLRRDADSLNSYAVQSSLVSKMWQACRPFTDHRSIKTNSSRTLRAKK